MSTKDITDKMVCEAYLESRDKWGGTNFEYPQTILQRITGQCEKVCIRAMERAEKRGLIEYGVSLQTGWLTEKGKSLLNLN
jgi:hypothetical protein